MQAEINAFLGKRKTTDFTKIIKEGEGGESNIYLVWDNITSEVKIMKQLKNDMGEEIDFSDLKSTLLQDSQYRNVIEMIWLNHESISLIDEVFVDEEKNQKFVAFTMGQSKLGDLSHKIQSAKLVKGDLSDNFLLSVFY